MLRALAIAAVLAPAVALAQPKPEPRVTYQPVTHLDGFDEDVVEGEFSRPDGTNVLSIKHQQFDSLIKIRWSFVAEIEKSGEDVR